MRGRESCNASRGTGCSTSPNGMPSRSDSIGAAASACSGVGCWSSWPQPQCFSRRSLTGPSLCAGSGSSLTGMRAHSLAFRQMSQPSPPHGDAPEILARGPWEMEQISAHWREQHFEPSPLTPRPPTPPSANCRSVAHRATTASPRGWSTTASTSGESESRCSLCAGRCVWSRATPRRAWPLCASREPPTVAGWQAGGLPGCPRGPDAGRWAPAARSTSARARRTHSCGSWRRSGPWRRSGCEARPCCGCRITW